MSENKRYVQFEFPYDDFAVKDNKTNEELWNPKVVDRLNEQDNRIKELERFKLSIISFAECDENINRRTLNDLIELIDYDRE